ncbi:MULTISPECIES: ATP-binding protein [unclassified Pseudoalteromonas]|uniref:ATP-binding protein n=1 Tax=unclassified Pseudoalteromonas TaxID=194690 RepID=UPI00390C89F7
MLKQLIGSLSIKVLSSLAIFILIQIIVYVVINERTDKIEQASKNVLNINGLSVVVFEINKDILQIQRDISVYGVSGSEVIFDKIKSTHQSIQARLIEAQQRIQQPEIKNSLNAMQSLVLNYGKSIDSLKKRYDEKSKIIEQQLPNTYELALTTLASRDRETARLNKESLLLFQLKDHWHHLYRNSILFLTQRDYAKRSQVKQRLQLIKQLTNSGATNKMIGQNKVEQLNSLTTKFESLFAQAIQANRNYLTLSNIVIAGDSVEFSALAKKLQEDALLLLSDISQTSQESINAAQTVIQVSLFLSVTLFILFALFFHFHIINAINRLTVSFRSFLNGDFSANIADINREDEIGFLAQAANKFRVLNERLVEAKKAAEETSRIKSEFLANMSHEIRTPMNGILGMVQLVSNTELDAKQKRMIEVISSSGNSLLVILNDILDLSKLDADKMLLENREFKLSALLYELEQIFKSQADHKNIEFKIVKEKVDSVDLVQGDETRLKQVLMNLLGNAFKFTECGTVTLSVDLKEKNSNEVMLLFSVIDSGIGISQHSIKTLFDAFTQADTSTTRRFGGTGLGLTISSKILNLMGSNLQVESELDKGSRFYFQLTLSTPSSDVNVKQQAQLPDVNIKNKDIQVLIAEDNPVNQIVLENFLKAMGIKHITVADNGEIALELCTKQQFDLIMMDIQMPVMSGLLATKYIRELANYHDVPIIAVTANITEKDEPEYVAAGITNTINKPIEFNSLKVIIDQYSE